MPIEIIGYEGGLSHTTANYGVAIVKEGETIFNPVLGYELTPEDMQKYKDKGAVTLMEDPFVLNTTRSEWVGKNTGYLLAAKRYQDLQLDLMLLSAKESLFYTATKQTSRNFQKIQWFLFTDKEERDRFGSFLQEWCLEEEQIPISSSLREAVFVASLFKHDPDSDFARLREKINSK